VEIQRVFDAEKINAVLNHPSVRPDIAEVMTGPIDVSAGVTDTKNVLLMGEYGGCFCVHVMPGVYEVHTQSLPEGRGRWIADFVRAASDWMFTRTDAYEIVTRIPVKHRAARMLSRYAGMKYEMTRPNECRWRGELQGCDIYSFRIQDWAINARAFYQSGAEFHDFLHAEAERLGVTEPPHDTDLNHNLYVGICLAMMEAGQVNKALNFYNRWALMVRHPIIQLVSTSPVTVRFDIGNLIFENGARRVELLDMAA
jgi:hypothetical protein